MRRTLLIVLLVVTASLAVPSATAGTAPAEPASAATAGAVPAVAAADADGGPATGSAANAAPAAQADRPENPTTEDTIGYVEGYWHDDSLPVDDRADGAVEDDELEAVIYRSMARVEVIRERTFEEPVPVEVISREEFANESGELFVNVTENDRVVENVRYEALFMVDRETDAVEAFETLYGGSVLGYYEPDEDQIVIVSDSPDEPELDELTLGHELHHALQDQRFGLDGFDESTVDSYTATRGLVEGDATLVETGYEERCGAEWDCVTPSGDGQGGSEPPSYGLFFSIFAPYSDGPDYVDALREEGGWDAVDAAYDDPPASSTEVVHPGEEREPAEIDLEDRSSERWTPLEADQGADHERFGEATMAAMFMGAGYTSGDGPLDSKDVFESGDSLGLYDYTHPVTDGWAGDELLAYTADDDETGFVWRSEWLSDDDAAAFAEGYRALIEANGGEAVEGSPDTYAIDDADGFPGAYAIERDGESVTIVRAPSVDELSEIRAGTATGVDGDDDGADADGGSDANDRIRGFGALAALVALLVLAALVARRR